MCVSMKEFPCINRNGDQIIGDTHKVARVFQHGQIVLRQALSLNIQLYTITVHCIQYALRDSFWKGSSNALCHR